MPTLIIPLSIRRFADGQESIRLQAASVAGAVAELRSRHPGIAQRLVDERGAWRRSVLVYVNDEDIRFLQNQQTPLREHDQVSVFPAYAGG